jgi:hypothetical protein
VTLQSNNGVVDNGKAFITSVIDTSEEFLSSVFHDREALYNCKNAHTGVLDTGQKFLTSINSTRIIE